MKSLRMLGCQSNHDDDSSRPDPTDRPAPPDDPQVSPVPGDYGHDYPYE